MHSVRNYQRELDKIVEELKKNGRKPKLLLHSCCAPCSSYVLEYLSGIFDMTLYFYNPNITDEEEYRKRLAEWKRLCAQFPAETVEGKYEPEKFLEMAEGMEDLPEGSVRCHLCYEMRMRAAVQAAAEAGADYFTTSLSISPHKNAAKINEIGERLSALYGVEHLPSDFKKKDGYKRSIELSKRYGLYRQDYCGCIYSKRKADEAAE